MRCRRLCRQVQRPQGTYDGFIRDILETFLGNQWFLKGVRYIHGTLWVVVMQRQGQIDLVYIGVRSGATKERPICAPTLQMDEGSL